MKKFIPIPVVDSGLYVFGGHRRTVPGGWSFFEQKHQAFELMCILDGQQTTKLDQLGTYTYGPGDCMIISPGIIHNNWNASSFETMTYITFHFRFESLRLESEIIRNIANQVIPANSILAKKSIDSAKQVVSLSTENQLDKEEINIKIQITILQYLFNISKYLAEHRPRKGLRFSEREAEVARRLALLLEENVDKNGGMLISFEAICSQEGISKGYGHRIFRKVYGMTPLHFMEKQKFRKAKLLLGNLDYSIEDIAYEVSAGNSSMFSKQFKKWSGLTPSAYRKQITKRRSVRSIKQSGYFE